jgi:hypothetical protein
MERLRAQRFRNDANRSEIVQQQESERFSSGGRDRSEVPLIGRQDINAVEAFSQDDN